DAYEGDLRLVGSNQPGSGTLQIFHDGKWGVMNSTYMDWRIATAACRQLGWTWGDLVSNAGSMYGGTSNMVLWNVQFACQSLNSRLVDCPRDQDFYLWTDDAYEGDLRLVGSNRPGSGTLQIFHDGKWGVMNSTYMDWRIATAACRQLGWTWGDLVSNAGSMYG
ncbi:hypothetical protein VOLCADRAFT_33817, partial [Volvox carteri f. nagariensis]